jgi:hypothetical protein
MNYCIFIFTLLEHFFSDLACPFSQAITPLDLLVELLPLTFYLFAQLSDTSGLFSFYLELPNSDWHEISWVSSRISWTNFFPKSAVFVLYPGRYIRISGAFRICQHYWHSHLA